MLGALLERMHLDEDEDEGLALRVTVVVALVPSIFQVVPIASIHLG